MPPFDVGVAQLFQSTLSMRRATEWPSYMSRGRYISIHALHEESDAPDLTKLVNDTVFQSTLSMRRATRPRRRWYRSGHFNPRSP